MRRPALALGLLGLLALGLLWWFLRGRSGDTPAAGEPPPAPAARVDLVDRPTLGDSLDPDWRSRKRPPPPPGFDPGTEGDRLPNRTAKLRAGEFPLLPPRFDDPADRRKFKDWWLREYRRRMRIYLQQHPGDTYPSDEEIDRLLEQMYDEGEPPRPGESAEAYDERSQRWFEHWRDFTAAFGEPPKTVLSLGDDPQYGAGEPPPVLPEDIPSGGDLRPMPTLPADSVPEPPPMPERRGP